MSSEGAFYQLDPNEPPETPSNIDDSELERLHADKKQRVENNGEGKESLVVYNPNQHTDVRDENTLANALILYHKRSAQIPRGVHVPPPSFVDIIGILRTKDGYFDRVAEQIKFMSIGYIGKAKKTITFYRGSSPMRVQLFLPPMLVQWSRFYKLGNPWGDYIPNYSVNDKKTADRGNQYPKDQVDEARRSVIVSTQPPFPAWQTEAHENEMKKLCEFYSTLETMFIDWYSRYGKDYQTFLSMAREEVEKLKESALLTSEEIGVKATDLVYSKFYSRALIPKWLKQDGRLVINHKDTRIRHQRRVCTPFEIEKGTETGFTEIDRMLHGLREKSQYHNDVPLVCGFSNNVIPLSLRDLREGDVIAPVIEIVLSVSMTTLNPRFRFESMPKWIVVYRRGGQTLLDALDIPILPGAEPYNPCPQMNFLSEGTELNEYIQAQVNEIVKSPALLIDMATYRTPQERKAAKIAKPEQGK